VLRVLETRLMTLRGILESSIADLTFEDVEGLIQEEAEEGPRLELKRSLPANDRQGDPWMTGAKRFSNPARDGLAKEVVALANAYGGAVVVGVDEKDDHPKRARGPNPILIPRIAACAEQVQQALDSLIDPPLAVLEVRGIEKPDSNGEGVLVIRTGPSTRAPHGHGRPPLAYMRRGSRSEPMTMRDLQSTLFETRTRGERINALLEDRRRALTHMVEKGPHGILLERGEQPFLGRSALYFRCTLVAVENLQLRADEAVRTTPIIRPMLGGSFSTSAFGSGSFHYGWAHRVNGVESIDHSSRHFARWFVGDQGIVDAYGLMTLDTYRGRSGVFAPILFPPVAIQVLGLGEQLRRVARRPEVELVVECEFINSGTATAIHGDGRAFDVGPQIPSGSIRIGPFSFGNIDDFQAVYAEIERGIWHGLGLPVKSRINFPMAEWMAEITRS
jgi:hypothetical protein